MGRIIELDTDWQSVSAAQDLAEIKLAATQAGFVHSVRVMQSSEEDASPTNEVLKIDCKRATGSFTSGSGGGSLTAYVRTGGAAHGLSTVERNNTTQASAGSGALDLIPMMGGSFNVNAGEWDITPIPELREPIGPSEALVVSLSEAPADAITLRCVVVLELTHG